jgi:hypothetical protein
VTPLASATRNPDTGTVNIVYSGAQRPIVELGHVDAPSVFVETRKLIGNMGTIVEKFVGCGFLPVMIDVQHAYQRDVVKKDGAGMQAPILKPGQIVRLSNQMNPVSEYDLQFVSDDGFINQASLIKLLKDKKLTKKMAISIAVK